MTHTCCLRRVSLRFYAAVIWARPPVQKLLCGRCSILITFVCGCFDVQAGRIVRFAWCFVFCWQERQRFFRPFPPSSSLPVVHEKKPFVAVPGGDSRLRSASGSATKHEERSASRVLTHLAHAVPPHPSNSLHLVFLRRFTTVNCLLKRVSSLQRWHDLTFCDRLPCTSVSQRTPMWLAVYGKIVLCRGKYMSALRFS